LWFINLGGDKLECLQRRWQELLLHMIRG